jgi:anti-sigma B factor antagonist
MKYAVDKQEKFTIFSIQEENLNSLLAPHLKAEFKILNEEEIPNLIVDFSQVKFVDSSGLSALLTGYRLWNSREGSFLLTNVNHTNVKRLIEISKLDNILVIIPTLEETVEYLYMEEIERALSGEEQN